MGAALSILYMIWGRPFQYRALSMTHFGLAPHVLFLWVPFGVGSNREKEKCRQVANFGSPILRHTHTRMEDLPLSL